MLLALSVVAASTAGTSAQSSAVNPSNLTASPLVADNTIEGAKSDVARLAQTDPSLLGRTDSTPVNVIIKYDYDSTASYDGGVAGLAATSPSKTGKELEANKGAVDAYESYTAAVSDKIDKAVESLGSGRRREAVVPDGVRRRVGGRAGGPDLESVEGRRRRGGPEGLAAPARLPVGLVDRRSDRVEQGRRPRQRRQGADRRCPRHRVWPEHPSFADHGLAPPPGT